VGRLGSPLLAAGRLLWRGNLRDRRPTGVTAPRVNTFRARYATCPAATLDTRRISQCPQIAANRYATTLLHARNESPRSIAPIAATTSVGRSARVKPLASRATLSETP
jgi:hypothetical protein